MEKHERFYNEELKKRYLAEKDKHLASSYYIEIQFRKCAKMEYDLDKDVSNWNTYEIVEYYKLLGATSYESLLCLNGIFINYCNFCIINNLVKDNQNHFAECTNDILFKCINQAAFEQKIISRDILLQWVEKLPNPKDQFVLLALFEYGKSKDYQNLTSVKFQDLNKESKTLKMHYRITGSKEVSISSKLISIIENCKNEDRYYSITGRESRNFPLIDYGYIIKSYPNQKEDASEYQKGRNIYIACQRIFKYLGVSEAVTATSIVDSGKIHFYNKENDYTKMQQQFDSHVNSTVFFKKYAKYIQINNLQ